MDVMLLNYCYNIFIFNIGFSKGIKFERSLIEKLKKVHKI
jgi:hypothetical protein